MEVSLGPVADLTVDRPTPVEVRGREYAVLRAADRVFVVRGRCPHQLAPLRAGTVGPLLAGSAEGGVTLDPCRRVLACPWHGWEFDVETGESAWGDRRWRLRPVEAEVRDGIAYVTLPDGG